MSFFDWLFRLFRSEPEPRPDPLETSDEPIYMTSGDEAIEVSLHTTTDLFEANGRIPEQMVARQLAHALDKTDYGYRISFNYALRPAPAPNKSVCGDDSTYKWWRSRRELQPAKDSNVLLCNTRGGGCGAVGGKVATTAGGAIDRLVTIGNRAPEDGGRLYRNLSGNLHEIGHNLGLGHDMDDASGKQHTGRGWNEDGYWHRTPMCVANGVDNLCGEHIPERQHQAVVPELYYHDCSVEHFDVK